MRGAHGRHVHQTMANAVMESNIRHVQWSLNRTVAARAPRRGKHARAHTAAVPETAQCPHGPRGVHARTRVVQVRYAC